MSFAKDILGIPKKSAEESPPSKLLSVGATPSPPPKRADGLSRELIQLTGGAGGIPTIAPSVSFKEKPQQKVSWVWKPFSNAARADDLRLYHWKKKKLDDDAEPEYAFAKFNRKVKIVEYTDEEYSSHLGSLQPVPKKSDKEPKGSEPWTKEETDALFEMCVRYDLRFIVIHDRWPADMKDRTVDELKDRYYSVARKLIETRQKGKPPPPSAFQKHCNAIVSNPFDIEYEHLRKKQLEEQYKRSKVDLRQEEETVREARRIEANRKRLAKERQRMQKLLLPAGDISVPEADTNAANKASKNKAAKVTIPGTVASAATLPTKNFPHRKSWNCAHARSSFLYQSVTQSARLAKRVEDMLNELKVGLRPMATASIVDAYDLLRVEVLAHIEMQRTVSRKEEEVHLLRVKLAKLKGDTPPPPPPGVHLSHKKRKTEDSLDRPTAAIFSGPSVPPFGHKRRKKQL